MGYKIKNSKIHGKGVFADKAYKKGEKISNEPDYIKDVNQSLLSFFHNHNKTSPNVEYVFTGDNMDVIAKKDIKAGEEITGNYYDLQYPGSPYEDPSKFEKKTLGKRKRKLKEGGEPDPPDKKTPIKSIFTDPRYKEYRKIKKENESIEELNKQIDLAKDAYDKRWSNVDDYTDSTQWMNTPQYLGFEKYKDLVPENENITFTKTFKTGENKKVYKGWGNTDWDASKKELVENYKKELPRYDWTQEEYDDYLDWAEKKDPEYFKKYNIRKVLKNLPIQNQAARSILADLGPKTDDKEVIEDVKKVEEDVVNTIEEIPVFDEIKPLPITDPNLKPFETEEIEFESFPEPEKLSELRKEERQDRRDSRGPGALSRFFENIGKPKPRYKKSINKQKRRFRRNLQDGGLAKFLDGGPNKISDDELSYFVDDAGKPFKYKGETWADVTKLSEEEQDEYIKAFQDYETSKPEREYKSKIKKSKLTPFFNSGNVNKSELDLYKKVFKVDNLDDLNAQLFQEGNQIVKSGDKYYLAGVRDIYDRVMQSGLTATQLSKMGLGSRESIKKTLKPIFDEHQRVYDNRNLKNIQKDVASGVSVKDAIKKIAGKNQGEYGHLMQLYKTKGSQIQDDIIDYYENYYSDSNKEGFFGSEYDKMNKAFKDENLSKMENIFEEMRTGKFNPNATMEDAINYYSQSTALDEAKNPLKKFTEEIKNKDLSNEEKIKLYNNIFPAFQKDQEKKARDAFFREQQGYFKSDEEMAQHLASQDDITNPYREASTFTKLLHPIDALGHLARYGSTDRMMEADPSAGIWDDNLIMQGLDGISYVAPVVGQLRAGQLLGDAGKGFVDYGSQWVKDGEAPDISYLAAPALQGTFGALGARAGLKNLFSTQNLASNIPGTVKPNYFSSPYKNIFKPNSQTFLARPNMVGTKTINLPGNRQIAYGNPFNTRGSNLVTKAQSKQLEQGQKLIDDMFTKESRAWDIIDFNKKRNLIGTGLTTPLSFTGTWDAMLGTDQPTKVTKAVQSIEKTGGVIKVPKKHLGGQYNRRVLNDLDRFLTDPYSSKKYSKSLAATNSVFAINDLFKRPARSRIYNPNAKYFKHGGELPKASRGLIEAGKSLASLYPDLRKVDKSILTSSMKKRIDDIAALKSLLTYGANQANYFPESSRILNYNLGKFISDKNILSEDIESSAKYLFNKKATKDLIKQGGKEKLLETILKKTGAKDFSEKSPFGLISSSTSVTPYDHKDAMRKLYDDKYFFKGDMEIDDVLALDPQKQLGFDAITDFEIAAFDRGPLGQIDYAVPALYGKNYLTPRAAAQDAIQQINQTIHNSPKYGFISDASSKTPDSYIMGMNQMLKGLKKYPDVIGNPQFLGYTTLNRGAFSDDFFKGKRDMTSKQARELGFKDSDDAFKYFQKLRNAYNANKLDKVYEKYGFSGLPALQFETDKSIIPFELTQRNRGLGAGQSKPFEGFFPSFAVQKKKTLPINLAFDIQFEDGGFSLGDEVPEHMVEELRRRGYTLEEVQS